MLIAPFGVFADGRSTHEDCVTFADVDHVPDAGNGNYHSINVNDGMDKDCGNHCSHCVFCSAVVISHLHLTDNIQSVYNPHISNFPAGVVSDVDIRPPKYFTSI